MTRYRLRFLLQEFDLARGSTLIGRSSECHVTIEDPLVSRQHACIVIDGDMVRIEDLGSRNGVKVNGVPIKGATLLKDGDRLRVGTQELVLCTAEQKSNVSAKTTGFLRHCATCRLPYPKEVGACPSCGGTEQTEDDTLSGQFGESSQGSWSMQLLVEVLQKALSLGRAPDAERILRRATAQVEERFASGERLDSKQLQAVCVAATSISHDTKDPLWGIWALDIHRRLGRVPSRAVLEALQPVARRFDELGGPMDRLVKQLRGGGRPLDEDDAANLTSLEQLRFGGSIDRVTRDAMESVGALVGPLGTVAVS